LYDQAVVPESTIITLNHWLGDREVPSRGEGTLPVISPFTGEARYAIPVGAPRDVDMAVDAARDASLDGAWTNLAPSQRKKILMRWADLIEENAAALDRIDAEDMGKPIATLPFRAVSAADLVRFNAEAIDKIFGDTLPSSSGTLVVQRWVPHGIVGAITPWNFPTFNAVLKATPALAGGNRVILKPSELSPRSALKLALLAQEAGLPAGALNVLLGRGDTVGKALAEHPGVDMVTFTGSTAVGKLVAAAAAHANMKPVLAECGGKSPHVVMDDGVDLDSVAAVIAATITTNQGQWCSVGSRVIVAESIAEQLIAKILAGFDRLVVGDPLDAGTSFGPLASKRQRDRVVAFIDDARARGARILSATHDPSGAGECFVAPTIIVAQSADDPVCQEEIFGPVLAILPFRDLAEAAQLANSTPYGLLAYVWTRDVSTGMHLARSIRSSLVLSAVPPLEEGAGHGFASEPVGASGIGMEGGVAGLKSYMRRQTVGLYF